jgi:V/A-type H+-transporting ATPase subunit E
MTNETTTSAGDAVGVQNLIDKLKNDGVSQGREEAERLVAEARAEAMNIVDQARQEAQEIVAGARKEAEQIETNGKQALQLASRDAALRFKEQLQQEFGGRLSKLVGQSLQDPELIRQMIVEITSATAPRSQGQDSQDRAGGDSGNMQLLVSAGNDSQANEKLEQLVRSVSGDMLSEGVEVKVAGEPESGVRIKLVEQDVEIELTETAITKWLMRFLAPRFRSIIEASS